MPNKEFYLAWSMPWRVLPREDGGFEIYTKPDDRPGRMNNFAVAIGVQHREEADFIVNACNSHASLVAGQKAALDHAVSLAAAQSNRLMSLNRLAKSGRLTAAQFFDSIGQTEETIERDLEAAHREFGLAKAEYEAFCRAWGLPLYATYNED